MKNIKKENAILFFGFVIATVLVLMLAGIFFTSKDGQIRIQIVTAVISLVTTVVAFFFGSSSGSQMKDETLRALASTPTTTIEKAERVDAGTQIVSEPK